jgi:hypothetical protein
MKSYWGMRKRAVPCLHAETISGYQTAVVGCVVDPKAKIEIAASGGKVMMRLVLASLAVAAVATGAAGQSSVPTFSEDVLPILQKNCQTCHRLGQVAPMSLISYRDARPVGRLRKIPTTIGPKSSVHITRSRRSTRKLRSMTRRRTASERPIT